MRTFPRVLAVATVLLLGAGCAGPGLRTEDLTPCESSGGLEACFQMALDLQARGEAEHGRAILATIAQSHPKTVWSARSRFLLAREAALDGRPYRGIDARQGLSASRSELAAIDDLILFLLAGEEARAGRAEQALRTLELLARLYPDSLWLPEAELERAERLADLGETDRAAEAFERFATQRTSPVVVARALRRAAELRLGRGENPQAAAALRRLWVDFPDQLESAGAEEELRRIGFPPTPDAWMERGRTLYQKGMYGDAAQAFEQVAAEVSSGPMHQEALLKLGASHCQLRRWSTGRDVLERLLRQRPLPPEIAAQALAWIAKAAIRMNDEKALFAADRRFLQLAADRSERAGILFLQGVYYEDQDQEAKALTRYRKAFQVAPQDPQAQEAIWRVGWIHYRAGRWAAAVQEFDRSLEQYPFGNFAGQVRYWKSRALQRAGKTPQAREEYARLAGRYRHTYYGQLAEDRLAEMRGVARTAELEEPDEPAEPSFPSPGFSNAPHYRRAAELTTLGLRDEAARELAWLAERHRDQASLLLVLQDLYRLGRYHEVLRHLRAHFWAALEQGDLKFPPVFWEMAYPLTFLDRIRQAADGHPVNPLLVAAVAREESSFNPNAVSRVGALGLLQVMPETGIWVADQIGIPSFTPRLLMDPEINLRIGSWYLAHLSRQCGGDVICVAASYNAGPDAVDRWRRDFGNRPPDEFVERIPFAETRFFVKRVTASYREYERITSEQTPAPLPVSSPG